MQHLTLSLLLALFFTGSINAQSNSLNYLNGFWLDSQKLSKETVREMMTENEIALKAFNNGRTLEVVGNIIGYPSAFILGYDLGTRLGGGTGNNSMLIAGGIGTAIGMIFGIVAESNYKNSVTLYNSGLKEQVSQLSFGITESGGIGFVYRL